MTNKTNTLAEDVKQTLEFLDLMPKPMKHPTQPEDIIDAAVFYYYHDHAQTIRQLLEVIAEQREVIKDAVFWIDACDVSESLVTPMRQSLARTKELTELTKGDK